jgi:putative flippase GtrA
MVDFGVANLLVAAGLPLWLAGTISFIAAIISNFTWNRFWTYPDSRSKPIMRQLAEFSFVSIMGLTIRLPILTFVDPALYKILLNLPFSLPLDPRLIGHNLTLAIAVLIVLFWNFFVNRFWTYKDVK